MRDDRPVSRCAVKGCPVIGHWPPGGRCPMHRDEEPPRLASIAEMLEVNAHAQ